MGRPRKWSSDAERKRAARSGTVTADSPTEPVKPAQRGEPACGYRHHLVPAAKCLLAVGHEGWHVFDRPV